MKTALQLIRDYFNPPALTMAELKELKKEDREELAHAIAKEQGLEFRASETPNASGYYPIGSPV
jgi:hypothetical protein